MKSHVKAGFCQPKSEVYDLRFRKSDARNGEFIGRKSVQSLCNDCKPQVMALALALEPAEEDGDGPGVMA